MGDNSTFQKTVFILSVIIPPVQTWRNISENSVYVGDVNKSGKL